MIRVGPLAPQIARVEGTDEVTAGPGIPALVDAVEDAGQAVLGRALTEQPVETAAVFLRRDLACIGLADRRQMAGIDDTGLQEGDLVVELHALDAIGVLRRADAPQGLAREQALIS